MPEPAPALDAVNVLGELTLAFPEIDVPPAVPEGDTLWEVLEEDWAQPLVYEQVVRRARTPDDELLLTRAFAFVERMMESTDHTILALAETGICEYLAGEPGIEELLPLMGPATAAQVRAWLPRRPPAG